MANLKYQTESDTVPSFYLLVMGDKLRVETNCLKH